MPEIKDLPRADYEVSHFEAGDYQDTFGNYWCNAAFVGVSEPVRWVVKDPQTVKVGEKYYGYFTLETGRGSGKPYIRFRKEQRPDAGQQATLPTGVPPSSTKPAWQPRDDNAIRAQWAIGQAVQACRDKDNQVKSLEIVEANAKVFYEMVDRVRNADTPPEAPAVTVEEQQARVDAQRDAEKLRNTFNDGSPVPDAVHDFDESEPISLADIPF